MLAATCVLALGACSRQADSNANAPGSPGTGNPTEVVRPAVPDSPPGGPSGIAGSTPHPGSSGGDAPPGISGSGTVAGSQQPTQPGQGLGGGLGSGSAMGASPAASAATGAPALDGSPNTSPSNAVGTRP